MRQVLAGLLSGALVIAGAGCAGGDTDTDGEVDAIDVTDGVEVTDTGVDLDVPEVDTSTDGADVDDPIGRPCTGNWDCQDGVYCNGVETCESGFCQRGHAVDCDDGFPCTRDDCLEEEQECAHTPDDSECDDGVACNGLETCTDALGCQPGTRVDCADSVLCTLDRCTEPEGTCTNEISDVVCDDMDPCTVDSCDTLADECVNTLIDDDSDGYPPGSCGGPDCDDDDPTRNPGAEEICDDSVDSNCNGLADLNDPACCTGSGDTCDCPVDMSRGGLLTGTTVGMANDYCGTCGASPCAFDGADVAFYLPIAERSLVQWAFASMEWSFYFHLHRNTCTGPEVLCQSYYYYGSSTTTQVLDAGFYYFILDSADMVSTGPYNIATLVTPITDVSGNDDCDDAVPAVLNHAYSGSLSGLTDDFDPPAGCTWDPDGRDATFRLTMPVGATVEITTNGSSVDTYLYLLDDTCDHAGLPCDDNSGSSGYYYWGASRIMTWLDPGTYHIIVDENTWYSYGDQYVLTINTF